MASFALAGRPDDRGSSGGKHSTIATMTEHRLFLGVENSATGRAWRDRLDERGAARALAIAQRHDLPELLARILAGRNVEADAVDAFLDPTIKQSMPDPLGLTAMKEAAERIADAVTRGECVAIFGDYDVDGATSAALLTRYLRQCGIDPIIHIPDRLFEGYGPNVEAVRALAERGAKLLVCVDCGTAAAEALAKFKAVKRDPAANDVAAPPAAWDASAGSSPLGQTPTPADAARRRLRAEPPWRSRPERAARPCRACARRCSRTSP